MAKSKTTLNEELLEALETQTATMERTCQEVRVLRQAIDEFRVDFTHLLRSLPDNLPPPYQHLTTLAESFGLEHVENARDGTAHGIEAADETICCYECDAASHHSLAQALHDGWFDLSCAEEVHGTDFVGWCPACQRAHEEVERQINAGPVHPQPVLETVLARKNIPNDDARDVDHKSEFIGTGPIKEVAGEEIDSGKEHPVSSAHSPMHDGTAPPATLHRSNRRKQLPLAIRIIQDPPYTDLVRFIGYGNVTLDKYDAFTQTLVERYGQRRVFDACQDLTEHVPGKGRRMQLNVTARQSARQVLGPPPESRAASTADEQSDD